MKITVYVTNTCPYCTYAKDLLTNKGIDMDKATIINLTDKPEKIKEMVGLTGRNTVPQIFINDIYVGGYRDLQNLDKQGRLDSILRNCTHTTITSANDIGNE